MIHIICISFALGLLPFCGCSKSSGEIIRIGQNRHTLCPVPERDGAVAFLIGSCEISAADYAVYLSENPPAKAHPQITCSEKGCEADPGLDRFPVAHVTKTDAENFCYWLSQKTGHAIRLPTLREYELAARGGINGTDFPWGWGSPTNHACFNTDGPAACGQYDPNPYGLYDMAGNVAEWCSDAEGDQCMALGGSWAERSEAMLRVNRRPLFPSDYCDADVGFRILVER